VNARRRCSTVVSERGLEPLRPYRALGPQHRNGGSLHSPVVAGISSRRWPDACRGRAGPPGASRCNWIHERFGSSIGSRLEMHSRGRKENDGLLDLFVGAQGGGIWHRTFERTWNAWAPLGAEGALAPAATSARPGRIDLFAVGPGDELLHRRIEGGRSGERRGGRRRSSGSHAQHGHGHAGGLRSRRRRPEDLDDLDDRLERRVRDLGRVGPEPGDRAPGRRASTASCPGPGVRDASPGFDEQGSAALGGRMVYVDSVRLSTG
jgi:hypothetical protein